MSAKIEMLKAREAMAAVLDAKLANMPEWQALRAIDRALASLDSEPERAKIETPSTPSTLEHRVVQRSAHLRISQPHPESYTSLTIKALEQNARPITTPELLDYIGRVRIIGSDKDKAKINITSSLSKDERFKSIPWRGGRAWWFSDRPVPQEKEKPGILFSPASL